MLRDGIVLVAGLLVAACADTRPSLAPIDIATITYEVITHTYCGHCDGATIVASDDGRVRIESRSWSSPNVTRRELQISSEQYQSFRDALAPYRPQANRGLNDVPCTVYETHSNDVRITWRDAQGEVSRLFRLGCSDESTINQVVMDARRTLDPTAP